jgi:hypothetical protein
MDKIHMRVFLVHKGSHIEIWEGVATPTPSGWSIAEIVAVCLELQHPGSIHVCLIEANHSLLSYSRSTGLPILMFCISFFELIRSQFSQNSATSGQLRQILGIQKRK